MIHPFLASLARYRAVNIGLINAAKIPVARRFFVLIALKNIVRCTRAIASIKCGRIETSLHKRALRSASGFISLFFLFNKWVVCGSVTVATRREAHFLDSIYFAETFIVITNLICPALCTLGGDIYAQIAGAGLRTNLQFHHNFLGIFGLWFEGQNPCPHGLRKYSWGLWEEVSCIFGAHANRAKLFESAHVS
jgi:hypothetical protein